MQQHSAVRGRRQREARVGEESEAEPAKEAESGRLAPGAAYKAVTQQYGQEDHGSNAEAQRS